MAERAAVLLDVERGIEPVQLPGSAACTCLVRGTPLASREANVLPTVSVRLQRSVCVVVMPSTCASAPRDASGARLESAINVDQSC
mmetsp:Transcript_21853/g.55788  ORF Transcript_21853/g.55788 Transcript_21853/m.55788 type:complete len:86 (-) Transcript_21853:92-349(-)